MTNAVNKESVEALSKWRAFDLKWSLALFGTAIGAGVLFFPIRAGIGGLIPILAMLILAFPIAYFAHRGLTRFCLSGTSKSGDITEVVEEHFGKTGGILITFMYFFAICPLLWIYGVTMTNTFINFWNNQLGMTEISAGVSLGRALVAAGSLIVLAVFIQFGKEVMVKVMGFVVFPFIASLLLISLLLIPYWSTDVFQTLNTESLSVFGSGGILITVWAGINIMVFSFNYSPIVSSFAVAQREEYEAAGGIDFVEKKASKTVGVAAALMVGVVMFFAFSCLFALSPADMANAKSQNIPVLSYLGNYFSNMTGGNRMLAVFLTWAAPIIALIAIFKSFFGHYLGTLEGLNGLLVRFCLGGDRSKMSTGKLNFISMVIIMATTWVVAFVNPNILNLIETMGAPIIACLLCLLPMYGIHNIPALAKYRGLPSNYFVTTIGLLTIVYIVYSLLS